MTYRLKLAIVANAQVMGLVAARNIPKKDFEQAKHLHFNDSQLKYKLFPHLFPLAQGGFIQEHKGKALGKCTAISSPSCREAIDGLMISYTHYPTPTKWA